MSSKLLLSFILFSLSIILFPPSTFAQQPWSAINPHCYYTHNNDQVPTLEGIECVVANILTITIRTLGIAVFIMFIVAGFKYLMASGDPKAMESAKNTLSFAIAGLAIAVLAWFAIQFISGFTGVNLDEFSIPIN